MVRVELSLGPYRLAFEKKASELLESHIVERIHELDHTVWKINPREITNRLGWLTSPARMRAAAKEFTGFADQVRREFSLCLLLGMGGSSLAPEVLAKTFGAETGFPGLSILDNTDPAVVRDTTTWHDPQHTLFIVSTKSGTTTETLSFFKHFFALCTAALGQEGAGSRFIAITDPDTPLHDIARRCSFKRIFQGEPTVGGRFSALSVFGMVPGALLGIDISRLLDRALLQAEACREPDISLAGKNPAASLGTALGILAKAGRDKITFFISEPMASFGDWVEQLVAESTGKEGTGIVPVVGEVPGTPEVYGPDRVFVSLHLKGLPSPAPDLGRLSDMGHPVIRIFLDDLYDMGALFYLWEFATAVAGCVLGINPFDQPDVEATKNHTRTVVEEYTRTGAMDQGTPALVEGGIEVYGEVKAFSVKDAMRAFLSQAHAGSYIGIQAFLNPASGVQEALATLRTTMRNTHKLATTLGYGPRFLHSTGQLHKGGPPEGLFIQLTSEDPIDIPIPDEPGGTVSSLGFAALKKAQWLGDARALAQKNRPLIRVHIREGLDVALAVRKLCSLVV